MLRLGESLADQIRALAPTADDDRAWAADKRRHAWRAFAKFGVVPGVAFATGVLFRVGVHGLHPWFVAVTAGAFLGSGFGWAQWHWLVEPTERLAALRAARLRAALSRESDEDAMPALADRQR